MRKLEQLGPYTLLQEDGVFPLGEDALALGAFATLKKGWHVCDLGTGSGCLLLMLAARDNLARNGLDGQIWTGDWEGVSLAPGSFDLVVSNPPYFAQGSGGNGGGARMEEENGLNRLCRTAARLTRNGGRFALCARPERLVSVFAALRENGLEPKRMQLSAHSPSHPPYLALVESVRQGRPGLEMLPLLYHK